MVADPEVVGTSETFIELLERRTRLQPEHEAFTFLHDGETIEASWTFLEIERMTLRWHIERHGTE